MPVLTNDKDLAENEDYDIDYNYIESNCNCKPQNYKKDFNYYINSQQENQRNKRDDKKV